MSLVMVAVLVFLVAGCGNNGSKKLVPVWVWDNYAMGLNGFLINDDGSVFVKEENRGVLQEVIAYYNPRKEFVHTTKYDEACVVNRRLITLDYSNNQSSIYDLSSEVSCLQIEGELCQEQIDKKSLLFENDISDSSKRSYVNLGKNLIKTNLNGIVLWSLEFKDNNSGYFYPVNLDENEKMTILASDNDYFNNTTFYLSLESSYYPNIVLNTKDGFWNKTSFHDDFNITWQFDIDETGKKINLFDIVTLDYKTGKIEKTISVDDIEGSLVKLIDKQYVLVAGGTNVRLIDIYSGKTIWDDKIKATKAYYYAKRPEMILLINGKVDIEKTSDIEVVFEDPGAKTDSNKPAGENAKVTQDTDKNNELMEELTMVDKASGKILWKSKLDYGKLTDIEYIDDKILLSFEKTTIAGKDETTEYKTIAANAFTGKTVWEKDGFQFEVTGNDQLNPIEIESFDKSSGKKLIKKHVILSTYVDNNRSKELVELETGKTVWKIDNPYNSQMDWMSVKDNQLFFVTHEGMMKYSLSDGSVLAKYGFDRAKLGSTKIQQDKAETLGDMLYPNQKRGILSEKMLGKKEAPIQPSSNEKDELLPAVKDGYVFVQASKKLAIYDLYTFDELYSTDILFDSCDVVNGYVYLKNQYGIAKLELQQ